MRLARLRHSREERERETACTYRVGSALGGPHLSLSAPTFPSPARVLALPPDDPLARACTLTPRPLSVRLKGYISDKLPRTFASVGWARSSHTTLSLSLFKFRSGASAAAAVAAEYRRSALHSKSARFRRKPSELLWETRRRSANWRRSRGEGAENDKSSERTEATGSSGRIARVTKLYLEPRSRDSERPRAERERDSEHLVSSGAVAVLGPRTISGWTSATHVPARHELPYESLRLVPNFFLPADPFPRFSLRSFASACLRPRRRSIYARPSRSACSLKLRRSALLRALESGACYCLHLYHWRNYRGLSGTRKKNAKFALDRHLRRFHRSIISTVTLTFASSVFLANFSR